MAKKKEYEVVTTFRDKETFEVHEKGTKYQGTTARIKELLSKGYIEEIKEEVEENESGPTE